MGEKFQNPFDVEKAFNLCQDIIKERKFESLVDLDLECISLINKINPAQGDILISPEEDAAFMLIFYIYYMMLDEKERSIFVNIGKLILNKNIFLYDFYTKLPEETWEREFSIEERKIGKYMISILNKYMKDEDNEEINKESLNKMIYYFYKNEFYRIPNNFYLIIMIGLGRLDLSEFLSQFSYDALKERLYNVTIVLFDHFFYDRDSFYPGNDIKTPEDEILDEVDELRT